MMTLPEEFSKQISAFAPLFRKKVFQHAKVLLTGCLLVVGRRTVCSALRAVGLGHQKNFHKYHRVLNLSRWSCYKASRILLYQLVDHFFDRSSPLVFGIDETIERRWVLLKGANGDIKPCALLCTDLNLSALEIVGFFVQRWNVEVTFQEARAHLGVETQRQWGDLAIARTTPVLMGLFSMVTLWADPLFKNGPVSLEPCAWYQKPCPTFSDAIACVRKRIWQNQKFLMSLFEGETHNSGTRALEHLISIAIRAA